MTFLTSTQFANAIGVSNGTLTNWAEKGILKPYMITATGRRKYTTEQVEEFFAKAKADVDNRFSK